MRSGHELDGFELSARDVLGRSSTQDVVHYAFRFQALGV